MVLSCFPCSENDGPCQLENDPVLVASSALLTWADRVLSELGPSSHGCRWFEVALWLNWPRDLFPIYEGYMNAPHAFGALEAMMRFHRRWSVSYGCVRALDGSIVYRAYRPWVHLGFEDEGVSDD